MKVREQPNVIQKRARLADPGVRRWYDNLARGSEITACNYLRSLFAFTHRTGISPAEAAKLSPAKAYEVLLDFVSAEENRGLAGSAIHTYVKAVKSWMAFNGVKVDRTIKVRGAQATPTLANEQVPTPQDVGKILLAATTQQRVAISLVAFSGVRLEVLGNYRGKDGLRVRDLPDLAVENGEASFSQLPARVIIRPELSKSGRSYFSFIGEGAQHIAAYLNERIRAGEKIGPDTDIFHSKKSPKRFVRTTKVSESMRTAIDRAGFDFRPFNLRCYFDTQLLLSESKGKCPHDYRVFWMGHTGSMENRYSTNKGRLPKDLLEDMRAAYHRSEAFLSTTETAQVDEQMSAYVRLLLQANGIDDSTIEKLGNLTPEKGLEALREAGVGRKAATTPIPPSRLGEQKLVPAADVEAWMNVGWSGKFAVGDRVMLEGVTVPSRSG